MRQSTFVAGRSMAPHVLTMGSFRGCASWNGGAYFKKLCQKHFHLKEVSVSEMKGNLKDAALLVFLSSFLSVLGQQCFLFLLTRKRSREQVN